MSIAPIKQVYILSIFEQLLVMPFVHGNCVGRTLRAHDKGKVNCTYFIACSCLQLRNDPACGREIHRYRAEGCWDPHFDPPGFFVLIVVNNQRMKQNSLPNIRKRWGVAFKRCSRWVWYRKEYFEKTINENEEEKYRNDEEDEMES